MASPPPERQLRAEVVESCRASLDRGAARRRAVDSRDAFEDWREEVVATVRDCLPAATFERAGDREARTVSTGEAGPVRVENVLFESLPGWEVNASVYRPEGDGPHPAVVCPSGHSAKTNPPYQLPPQVFARNGYVAVAFDAPGRGEKAPGSDHFEEGVVGYLVEHWSQAFFVADALACLDYLCARPDVDPDAGLAVTGVSGGGVTSLYVGLLDDRVDAVAPVCCLAELDVEVLSDLYTACPEQFGHGLLAAGVGWADLVGALAPTPCLAVAGAEDATKPVDSARRVHDAAADLYAAAGAPDRLDLFVDGDSGHDYTVAMAVEGARWFDRHLPGVPGGEGVAPVDPDDLTLLAPGDLHCHPRTGVNMFSVLRDRALALRESRADPVPGREALAAAVAGLLAVDPPVEPVATEHRGGNRVWASRIEEVSVRAPARSDAGPAPDLPGVFVSRESDDAPRPGLLWLDEGGRWEPLRQDGYLAGAVQPFEADPDPATPCLLSLDLSGIGRLDPAPVPYDVAGWNDVRRILSYLAVGNAEPVAGLRVRDALCGLACLRDRPDVDTTRLAVGGRGLGAVVALHAALLAPDVGRVVCLDPLVSFEALARASPREWPASTVVPGALARYDLPGVAAVLADDGVDVRVHDPRDARRERLSAVEALDAYEAAEARGAVVASDGEGPARAADAAGDAW
jgi:dienelactone hydrolase